MPLFNGTTAGKIEGFKATLDGQAFVLETDNTTQELHLDQLESILTAGVHHLIVSGTGIDIGGSVKSASYGGTMVVSLVTPIPAAIWLFGSDLLGLVGAHRRKSV